MHAGIMWASWDTLILTLFLKLVLIKYTVCWVVYLKKPEKHLKLICKENKNIRKLKLLVFDNTT